MKKMIVLTALVLFSLTWSLAYSETIEHVYALEEEVTYGLFTIEWDNRDVIPEVELTSPTGLSFGTQSTPERVSYREGMVLINVGASQAGDWKLMITGEDLGSISMIASELPLGFGFKTIDYKQLANGDINISGALSIDDPEATYDYTVGLAKSNNRAIPYNVQYFDDGGNFDITVSHDKLINGIYYIYLEVKTENGIMEYEYSQKPFIISQGKDYSQIRNFEAGVDNHDMIQMSWDSDYDTKDVYVYDPDTLEVIGTYMTGYLGIQVPFPEGYDRVYVAVSPIMAQDKFLSYPVKEVSRDQGLDAWVKIPQSETINSGYFEFEVGFEGNDNNHYYVLLDGELEIEDAYESGKHAFEVEDGSHRICVGVSDGKGNIVYEVNDYYFDSRAPQVFLTSEINNIATDEDTILVEGIAEKETSVTINDETVALDEGYFAVELPLSQGENLINISTVDQAKNEVIVTGSVYQSQSLLKRISTIMVIILSVFIGLMTLLWLKDMKR